MATPQASPASARRTSPALLALLALTIGGLLALLLVVGLDRAYGLVRRSQPAAASATASGLIYTPGERVRHVTPEFDYRTTINSFGFRGPEPRDGAYRIAAFGDSWVYGWGVNDDEHFVALLQDSLRARLGEPRVELLNLGSPGASPSGYAGIAERAIPALRPKLVLVGVLQGQDFAQLWWETQTASERMETLSARELPAVIGSRGRGLLARVFPNFSALVAERARTAAARAAPAGSVSDSAYAAGALAARRAQAAEIERTLSREGRRRFEALSPEVREAFRRGDFNPVELYYALRQPGYFALTMQLDTERGRAVVAELARQLRRIREAADRVGAATVVLSMPYGAYVSPEMCANYRSLGYRCDSSFLRTDLADEATRRAAREAGIAQVVEVTEGFRAADDSARAPLFFRLDGHLTREGNRVYAGLLAPEVAARAAAPLGLARPAAAAAPGR